MSDLSPLSGGFCCKTLLVSIAGLRFGSGGSLVALPLWELRYLLTPLTRRLRKAHLCQRWRGTAEKPGEPSQVLRSCCEQHFISDATQAPQPEPVESENPFHVRKSHLNLLAFTV